MKKEELRIGNLFIDTVGCYCNPNTIQSVKSISYNGVNDWQDMGASGVCPFDKTKPIPLTEEWLLQLGFTSNGFTVGYLGIENFSLSKLGGTYIVTMGYDSNFEDPEILFVHQLQNLYFALTGKELEIK